MTRSAFVAGAGGAVGEACVHALLERGWRVTASMRTPRERVRRKLKAAGAEVRMEDLKRTPLSRARLGEVSALVFATHLRVTMAALGAFSLDPAMRLIALSSNNIAVHPEASAYRELALLEAELGARHSNLAILRPTLIYGDPRLAAITRLMRLARLSPFLPLLGSGRARVQPVFFKDVANATASLAELSEHRGVYALGGPNIMTMRDLYERIIQTMESRARIVALPQRALKAMAAVLGAAGIITKDQIERAEFDRVAVSPVALPAELAPVVPLEEGLARLAAALGEAA